MRMPVDDETTVDTLYFADDQVVIAQDVDDMEYIAPKSHRGVRIVESGCQHYKNGVYVQRRTARGPTSSKGTDHHTLQYILSH